MEVDTIGRLGNFPALVPWIDGGYVHIHSLPELMRSGHPKNARFCRGELVHSPRSARFLRVTIDRSVIRVKAMLIAPNTGRTAHAVSLNAPTIENPAGYHRLIGGTWSRASHLATPSGGRSTRSVPRAALPVSLGGAA